MHCYCVRPEMACCANCCDPMMLKVANSPEFPIILEECTRIMQGEHTNVAVNCQLQATRVKIVAECLESRGKALPIALQVAGGVAFQIDHGVVKVQAIVASSQVAVAHQVFCLRMK